MSYTGLFKSNVVILNCKIVEHTPQFHFKYSLAFFIPCTYVVFIMIQSGYYDQRTLPDIHMLQEINLFITVYRTAIILGLKLVKRLARSSALPWKISCSDPEHEAFRSLTTNQSYTTLTIHPLTQVCRQTKLL